MNRMLSKGENLEVEVNGVYFSFEIEEVESNKLTLIKKEITSEKIQKSAPKIEMFLDPSI
jgi:hypothetical protein